MKKADRQRRLLEIISARRYEKISRLAEELNVSHDTISRDLNELTESASFYISICMLFLLHGVVFFEGFNLSKYIFIIYPALELLDLQWGVRLVVHHYIRIVVQIPHGVDAV